jgi:tRNA-splicing ligase RtcB
MGTRSYIVAGKGNPQSWTSCAHGAGRRHSRTKAKALFSPADLAEQMSGKVWLADRADLVEVLHTLHQVLNCKGT